MGSRISSFTGFILILLGIIGAPAPAGIDIIGQAAPIVAGSRRKKANFSRAYLRHLVKADEILGSILLTTHNLYFLFQLMEELRKAIRKGTLEKFAAEFLSHYP